MKKMGRNSLSFFRELPDSQKRKLNRLIMNEYIQNLGINWETTLLDDFNLIVNEDILNEDFDPTTNINTDRQFILSQEQEEWIKKETEETGKEPLY